MPLRRVARLLETLAVPVLVGLVIAVVYDLITRGMWAAATFWTAAQGIGTLLAFWAALKLYRGTANEWKAGLVLRLSDEYDGLRESIELIEGYYMEFMEFREGGKNPVPYFRDNIDPGIDDPKAKAIYEARFKVSRFFAKIRKLVRAGYLSEELVISAIDRGAFILFVNTIEPLDKARPWHGYNPNDRDFYVALLDKYPRA